MVKLPEVSVPVHCRMAGESSKTSNLMWAETVPFLVPGIKDELILRMN